MTLEYEEPAKLTAGAERFYNVFQLALKIPGIEVNRKEFLKEQLAHKYDNLEDIIKKGPIKAGVDPAEIKKIANGVANWHTTMATVNSAVTGLPGGWAMLATIPADVSQYYCNCLRCAQKIAYLYGVADLKHCPDMTKNVVYMALLVIALGQGGDSLAKKILSNYGVQVGKKMIASGGTKLALYKTINQVAVKLGYSQLTKRGAQEVLKKSIPIFGAIISGGITLVSCKLAFPRVIKYFEREYVTQGKRRRI